MQKLASLSWSFMKAAAATSFAGGLWLGCGSSTRPEIDEPDSSASSSSSSGDSTPPGPDGSIVGSSSSSGGSGGATCATATTATVQEPLYVDFVLDNSGSMDFDPKEADPESASGRRTGTRWLAARDGVRAYAEAKGAVGSDRFGARLTLFSGDTATRSTPLRVLDSAHALTFWNAIKPPFVADQLTPLNTSMNDATSFLRGFQPTAPLVADGRRAIVLITDGGPTDGSRDDLRAKVEAALAGTPSIVTAVLGVGDIQPGGNYATTLAPFLSGLAQAGGASLPGCDPAWTPSASTTPCHVQVTPGTQTAQELQLQMAQALDAIAGTLTSCELELVADGAIDPGAVNVVMVDANDGRTQIAQEPTDGWVFDDPAAPTKVILKGASCNTLKGTPEGHVEVVVGCPTGTNVVN